MAVAHVATGTVAFTASATTLDVVSPAGAIGDLLIFMVGHDDYGDGEITDDSPPITLTDIDLSATQLGDDVRGQAWWGIETQAAGRTFNFDWTVAEEGTGVCIRYNGHDPTTPIEAGSLARGCVWTIPPTNADTYGGMFVAYIFSDSTPSGYATPTGWTNRVTYTSGLRMYVNDRPATTYGTSGMPFELAEWEIDLDITHASGIGYHACFVINPSTTAYTLTGTTKDKDGTALGSCEVHLFRRVSSTNIRYIANTTSHATTGAYSFTVNNDNAAEFFVVAFKADTPHVMDCTDWVLQPT